MAQYTKQISLTSYEAENIKISLKALYDHFQCPVCRCTLSSTALTTCGHRYCHSCIQEWISRRHECAVCRCQLDSCDVVKDSQYDELLKTIVDEKTKEEKLHYDKMADQVSDCILASKGSRTMAVSPLESVLHEHLKRTLKSHEVYHQQVVSECQRSQSRVHQEKQLKIERILKQYPHDPDHPERLKLLKQVETEWEVKRKELTDELARVEGLLCTAYDRYLEKSLPLPSTVPVTVKLSVPEKDFVADDVIVKPNETMDQILAKLKQLMIEKGIEIAEFPPCEELQISLLSPFAEEQAEDPEGADVNDDGPKKMLSVPGDGANDASLPSLLNSTLHGDCRPVLQYNLRQGSEIRISGQILLEGEQPMICFAASFVKGQSKATDYFVCKSCNNTTWICKSCAAVCHRDHDLIPHRMNHVPTWACCYCRRRKMCVISETF